MFIQFKTHPEGVVVTVNTAQVTTIGPDPKHPSTTLIRFSDGREVVVAETPEQVVATMRRTRAVKRPKKR